MKVLRIFLNGWLRKTPNSIIGQLKFKHKAAAVGIS